MKGAASVREMHFSFVYRGFPRYNKNNFKPIKPDAFKIVLIG